MSQYVTTPNLGLFKPTYRLDAGTWGLHWNANADKLDQVLGPNGPFLPLTGGVLSGPGNLVIQGTLGVQGTLSVAGATSLAGLTMVPGTILTLGGDPHSPLEAATKQYVDGGAGTVPGGPFLSLSGGVLNGPGNLGVQGTLSVTGNTTLSSVSASGNLTVSGGGNLTVSSGTLTVSGNVTGSSFVVNPASGDGGVQIQPASGHTGYIGFFNPSGTRTGYVGFAAGTTFELNCEGLNLQVTAPNASFSGVASVAGTLSGNGVYSNAGFTLNGTGGGLGYDGTYIYYKQDSGNWSWRYTRSNGTMAYVRGSDNFPLFTIDGGGSTSTAGSSSCHNAFSIYGDAGQSATMWLNPGSGQAAQIISTKGGLLQWNMQLGNGSAANDFQIHRYDDAGHYVDAPLTINRATSAWTMLGVVTAGAFATNGTLTANSGATVGGLSSTAGVTAAGRIQANDFMCNSGAFFIGGNTAYYLARNGTDGNWRFVENNTTNFTIGPSGDVSARSGVYGTYLQSSGQVVAGTSMRVFGVGTNWSNWGSTNYIGFSWNATNLDVYVDYIHVGNTPSDERLKTVVGPYERGLAELRKIDPVLYRLKGNDRGIAPDADTQRELNDGPSIRDTEKVHVGFVAQKVEGVFPELVKRRAAVVDGEVVDDVRYVDEGPWMSFAVINALKEIDARLSALEGKR